MNDYLNRLEAYPDLGRHCLPELIAVAKLARDACYYVSTSMIRAELHEALEALKRKAVGHAEVQAVCEVQSETG